MSTGVQGRHPTPVGPASAPARPHLVLALLCAAQFMIMVDLAAVNVALPALHRDLAASREQAAWVLDAYVVAYAGALLLGGRTADRWGRRRTLTAGLVAFTAASLLCGLAGSVTVLIAGRAVQGLGAAFASPAALSLVLTAFRDGPARQHALGVWTAVASGGGAAGVLLGGALTQLAGWPWVFLVNVPVGVGVIALVRRHVVADQAGHAAGLAGSGTALRVTAGLALLVLAVLNAGQHGLLHRSTALPLALAAALLAVVVRRERRGQELLPWASLGRAWRAPAAAGLLVGAAALSTVLALTLYAQEERRWSPLSTGVLLLVMVLPLVLTSAHARRPITRFGAARVLMAGALLASGGRLVLALLPVDGADPAVLLAGLVLTGVGAALMMVPLSLLAVRGAGAAVAGAAAGLFTTSVQVGGAIGVAVAAPLTERGPVGLRMVFLFGAVALLLLLLLDQRPAGSTRPAQVDAAA